MNREDIKKSILGKRNSFYCFVGHNTTGKSYFLNEVFSDLKEECLYFDEKGFVKSNFNRNNAVIEGDYYYYQNDTLRGQDVEGTGELIKVSHNSKQIIMQLNEIQKRVKTKYQSLGSEKLLYIVDSLLNHNLNDMGYVFFDEPENALDDENIKNISSIIKTLVDKSICVCIVTHSPRFLEVVGVNIDDIYIFKKLFEEPAHVTIEEVVDIYKNVSDLCLTDKVVTVNRALKEYEKYDFEYNCKLASIYLDYVLHSSQFYRSLFYDEIMIVEGKTEELILTQLKTIISSSNNYFCAEGKNKIVFLAILFSKIHDKVYCFIDSDIDPNRNRQFVERLTEIIENLDQEYSNIKTIKFEPDLENYLGIDKDEVVKKLSGRNSISGAFRDDFIRHYKCFLAPYVVSVDDKTKEKLVVLFKNDSFKGIYK